ncbi:hypothetical protein GUITHDRAFT_143733 [Guillardia theta CCMP2712]|uniref:Globin family profile domain-containing protein n=1 Tax=Guillardia theta (strain CCMP2712) TaxID=905079 RepID=L1IS81_GUITC|nr:hypothetical protein GUITHDRAFT_143733 [Guillardia theta CCMP2712]EKX39126.1 hypothetical protein GUITHDRAFT_143733 [Guillardia theta CCMP2712]|eukprot:XP_005826106.1 hypothetical protein GUITHDRAFT_143733 [Guillardia theta CCMP2712]
MDFHAMRLPEDVLEKIQDERDRLGHPVLTDADLVEARSEGKMLIIIAGMVFDVTKFLEEHPGGFEALERHIGRDASDPFFERHDNPAFQLLPRYYYADYAADDGTAAFGELPILREESGETSMNEDEATADAELKARTDESHEDHHEDQDDERAGSGYKEDLPEGVTETAGAAGPSQEGVVPAMVLDAKENGVLENGSSEEAHSEVDSKPDEEEKRKNSKDDDKHSVATTECNQPPTLNIPATGCPFMALAMLKEAGHEPVTPSKTMSRTGSFKMRSGSDDMTSNNPYGSFSSFPNKATESPRSVRSREDLSSSRPTTTKNSSSMNSRSRKGRGTNINKAGGVFRGQMHRKRRLAKLKKAPPIDQYLWDLHSARIASSWTELVKKSDYAEIGRRIYGSVKANDTLEPLFRFTNQTVQGTKFVDMLSSIVENINNPQTIFEKVNELAPMHHRKGVKAAHMPIMKGIIVSLLKHVLGDEFTNEDEEAWNWIWQYLTQILDQSLQDVGSNLGLVRECWDSICEQYTTNELGEMVYDHLFKMAPNLTMLFTKPRSYMAVKMGDMLSMLVSFADSSESMKQQISWLGLRHVKYKIRPHHIPLMGPVFLAVVAEAAGVHWSQDTEKAWSVLFNMVCVNMADAIQEGEEYAEALEKAIGILKEQVDATSMVATIRAELATNCPSMFDDEASSGSKGLSRLKRSGRLMSVSSGNPSNESVKSGSDRRGSVPDLALHDVSHLLHASAAKKKEPERKLSTTGTSRPNANTFEGMAEETTVNIIESVYDFFLETGQNVWDPEKQMEIVAICAPRLFAWGMREKHLKDVWLAIERAITKTAESLFDERMISSLRWFWKSISEALQEEFNASENGYNDLVLSSWDIVRQRTEVQELGEKFWKYLNCMSPEQTNLFRRSLSMWGHLLHHIVNMLLISITDPEEYYDLMFELTIRHIRYGVRSEYLNPFGNALFATFEEILSDVWEEKTTKAWKLVWKRATCNMSRGLNMGGNAITQALVEGNVEALQDAISSAPRSKRAEWLCQIDINGAIISPLIWAMHDGKTAIVDFILSDLLTIRADIHGYYYGREELFKYHDDLIGEILREAPDSMTVLLDGLMWHSKEKLMGRLVRVNYYIKDVYGEPRENVDSWASPLGRFIVLGDNHTFLHPIVKQTLQLKWQKFGLFLFCLKEVWYLGMLITFMVGHVQDPSGCIGRLQKDRIALSVMAVVTLGVQMKMVMTHFVKRLCITYQIGSFEIIVPRCLASIWTLVRITSCVLLIYVMSRDGCNHCVNNPTSASCTNITNTSTRAEYWDEPADNFGMLEQFSLLAAKAKGDTGVATATTLASSKDRSAMAFVGVLLWIQMFQACILSTPLAAFTYTIGIMFLDISHSLFMIFILISAFGSALTMIGEPPFDQGWDHTLAVLLQEVLGVSQQYYPEIGSFTRFLLLVYVSRIFDDIGFDEPLNFSANDSGPAGGVQLFERDDHPKYVPDRILRFTGDASPEDPWPEIN